MVNFTLTILSAVLIFSFTQILLKLVIEPSQQLKISISLAGSTLLRHQAALTNAACDIEISNKLKDHAAEILSKSSIVSWYWLARFLFGIPSKANIILSAQSFNRLSYGMNESAREFENSTSYNAKKTDFALENSNSISEIGKYLGIKTTYQ
ncbi:hypothetical protein [Marinomonas primoryensis]|jgi:hypothetical protein|uniref:Uncharacterized protein n=1 Tax=Marinomonas primoryensis TaxID=178399 RepID=A0ABV0KYZ7_9GAMM|tara:strand:- start:55402 stop:55857 length:456 start_codon:yes stop_codon:yes gene_type:complete